MSLDFVTIRTKVVNKKLIVYPDFNVDGNCSDLMVRGKAFYAVWDEGKSLWSKKEADIQKLVDAEVRAKYQEQRQENPNVIVEPEYLRSFSNNRWLTWQKFVKSAPDSYHLLDMKVHFADEQLTKKDYATRKLSYAMREGDTSAWDKLLGVLYADTERQKLEWAIGAIISGYSTKLQKFIVLYGEPGSGKSTVLNIIQDMFPGYWAPINAKELSSKNNSFALEQFKDDPLIGIQHDGDLSRIEDNTLLNSVVAHEPLLVNEKFKAKYKNRYYTFLFLGTNRPVKITEAKSGIIRRLIDIHPTGKKLAPADYDKVMHDITFEYGAIAYKCLDTFKKLGKSYYSSYKPVNMIGETNDFFNFIEDEYDFFISTDPMFLSVAWNRYRQYCDDAKVPYPYSRRMFKNELKNYYESFKERARIDGHDEAVRNVYFGFLNNKFFGNENSESSEEKKTEEVEKADEWLEFKECPSAFDILAKDYPAQYAGEDGLPASKWDNVKTMLKDLDTHKLHYVRVPENHIVIDLDIKGGDGKKSRERNIAVANTFPPTYAEFSKSGCGIHLHYIYTGDARQLASLYDENVEIKVFTGKQSLRRKLTQCNDLDISKIGSGLPLKEAKNKLVDENVMVTERSIRKLIARNLRKEIHPATKPSMDFIYHILEEAYKSGVPYDVRDMKQAIWNFAAGSSHHADYCENLANRAKYISANPPASKIDYPADTIVFFDVEVFPNVFIFCWKIEKGEVIKMINPPVRDLEPLLKMKLIGFYNRKYDNHIVYAWMLGYTNEQLYHLSKRLIAGPDSDFDTDYGYFTAAYNLSYADVYDFCTTKMSLKKWEIELGIFHLENEYPWDEPLPEDKWNEVANYCANDVIATQKVFEANQQDYDARLVLAKLSGLPVNCTTRQHSTKIIFGDAKRPALITTNLATGEAFSDIGGGELDMNLVNKLKPGEWSQDLGGKPDELTKKYIRQLREEETQTKKPDQWRWHF